MKPRDPSHLAHLNRKYSHETKFYLKIFGDLLQAKRRHYSCLNYTQRKTLDHSIVDLQNFLDYHLLLIGENDQNGDWNEVWSMSPTHPAYEAYRLTTKSIKSSPWIWRWIGWKKTCNILYRPVGWNHSTCLQRLSMVNFDIRRLMIPIRASHCRRCSISSVHGSGTNMNQSKNTRTGFMWNPSWTSKHGQTA